MQAGDGLIRDVRHAGQEIDLCPSLIAGMVSQQLSNEPEAAFDGPFSRFVRHIPELPRAAYSHPADGDHG